jgi:predicted outer membrane repeat protein
LTASTFESFGDLLTDCIANNGACIYAVEDSVVQLMYTEVTDNDLSVTTAPVSEQVYMDSGKFSATHARFRNNKVSSNGALGLYSVQTTIANCSFEGNVASTRQARGAAIYLSCSAICDSSLSLVATITHSFFINNSAPLGYGGAIYATNYPGLLAITDSYFYNNSATFGGAVSSTSSLVNISSSRFHYNSASSGGGAVFWTHVDNVDVHISSDCEDVGNSADYGPFRATSLTKLDVSFDNSAQISGSLLTSPISVYLLDFYSQIVTQTLLGQSFDTTIYCSVYNDSGVIKGSTIIAASRGVANFTQLVLTGVPGGNTTLQFSAPLTLVDVVYLTVSFRLCISGEVTKDAGNNLYTCQYCGFGSYSFNPMDTDCKQCPAHVSCPGGNVLDLDKNYWRVDENSDVIYECPIINVCLGGTNVSTQCADGQSGAFCSVCEDGYTQDQNGKCYACDNSADVIAEVLATTLFLVVIGAAAAIFKFRKKLLQIYHSWVSKMNRVASNRKFQTLRVKAKIVISFCQIIYEMGPALSIVFPTDYSVFISYYALLQLNLVNIPNIGCVFSTNYYDQLLFSTIAPFVIFTVAALAIQFTVIRARRLNERNPWYSVERARKDTINAAFAISYFVLVNVSTKVFQVFQCETFDNGESYLVADYSISCNAPERSLYLSYGSFMILIYPIGIPMVYAMVLFRNRKRINPDWRKVIDADEKRFVSNQVIQKEKIKVRNTYEEIDNIKLLFDSYVPKRWYFELFECARRLLLGAVPVLIFRGSVLQIIIVLLVSLFSVATFMHFNPYIHIHDNHLAIVAQWSITLVIISGLIIKVEAVSTDENHKGLGVVLILINLTVVALAISSAFMNSKEKIREARHDEEKGEENDEEEATAYETDKKKHDPNDDDLGSDEEEEGSIDSDDEVFQDNERHLSYPHRRESAPMELELNPIHSSRSRIPGNRIPGNDNVVNIKEVPRDVTQRAVIKASDGGDSDDEE